MTKRNVPITHPILIAYEKSDYAKLKGNCGSRSEAIEMIEDFHEKEDFINPIKWSVIDANSGLQDIHLFVFFLRVEDTQQFKDDLEGLI